MRTAAPTLIALALAMLAFKQTPVWADDSETELPSLAVITCKATLDKMSPDEAENAKFTHSAPFTFLPRPEDGRLDCRREIVDMTDIAAQIMHRKGGVDCDQPGADKRTCIIPVHPNMKDRGQCAMMSVWIQLDIDLHQNRLWKLPDGETGGVWRFYRAGCPDSETGEFPPCPDETFCETDSNSI